MKKRPLSGLCLALCAAFVLFFPAADTAFGVTKDAWVLLRVRDLNKVMNGLDSVFRGAAGANAPLPSDMIGNKVGKLTFLDPARTVTALVDVSQEKPMVYCLVPIREKNENFREQMKAVLVKGAYVFSQPAGAEVPAPVADRLAAASVTPMKDTISADLPLSALMASVGPKIDSGLAKLSQQAGAKESMPPEKLAQMVKSLVSMCGQAENLYIGISWDKDLYRARFVAKAVPGTDLFRMLSAPAVKQSMLSGYTPPGAMTVRIRPYDVNAMAKLMSGFYQAIGFDISCLTDLAGMMTGEAVAGIAFSGNRMIMEGMWVLAKPGITAEDFAAKYVACAGKMAKAMQAGLPPGAPPVPLPEKTPETTVSGKKVTGIRVVVATPEKGGKGPAAISYDLRMAEVGNVVVFGPNDKAVARLIGRAEKISAAPYDGPLVKVDMDMAALMRWAVSLEPGARAAKFKGPARLSFVMDAVNGEATASYSIKAADAKRLFASLENFKPKPQVTAVNVDTGAPVNLSGGPGPGQGPAAVSAVRPDTDMVRQANLAMIYGGPKQAVKLYREALAINPENAIAHFNLAEAYCELQKYTLALAEAERALELSPGNPEFLYGRARILLVSGDKTGAVVGFTEAAALGSGQAQVWLDRMSQR